MADTLVDEIYQKHRPYKCPNTYAALKELASRLTSDEEEAEPEPEAQDVPEEVEEEAESESPFNAPGSAEN